MEIKFRVFSFEKMCFGFNYVHVHVAVCGYVHMSTGTCEGQKRASDIPEQESQVCVCWTHTPVLSTPEPSLHLRNTFCL